MLTEKPKPRSVNIDQLATLGRRLSALIDRHHEEINSIGDPATIPCRAVPANGVLADRSG